MRIGILAYGSLIEDPGEELKPFIEYTVTDVTTPFQVEFARSSRTRDGGPTLIPVTCGGAQVQASVLALKSSIELNQAETLLWRRETRKEGSADRYSRSEKPGINDVLVESECDIPNFDVALYTRIRSNIEHPTAEDLATLAICSARGEAGAKGKDGISYLSSVMAHGISTPLLPGYLDAILRRTGARDLEEAHRVVRLIAAGEC